MATPTATQLATPTVGAWQRAHSQKGMCDEARHLLAITYTQEWQRVAILERLDNIQRFLTVGATPDQAMTRLAHLLADYHGAAA